MNMVVLERPVVGYARGAALTGVRAPRSGRLAVGVLDLIEWAFQREKVGLDFDEIEKEILNRRLKDARGPEQVDFP